MWKLRKATAALAAAMLLGAAAVPSASVSAASTPTLTVTPTMKVHPLLQIGAQQDPLRIVRVIVQKSKPDINAAGLASKVLGQVVEEYKVVPAFVLDVPQGAIPTLAADPGVRYISLDSPVQVVPNLPTAPGHDGNHPPAKPKSIDEHHTSVTPAGLLTVFPFVSGATQAWSGQASSDRKPLTGANVAVAVIDSGIDPTHEDFAGRVVAVNVNSHAANGAVDGFGHGTHVAGIVAGQDPQGQYLGIAPNATIVSVKVTDDTGAADEADLLRGMDWVYQNRGAYHIGVVNMSVTTSVPSGYATSPVDAAVEALYHQNVTVVAASGNLGNAEDAVWYAPGNDPLALTVGCLDDDASVPTSDDSLCSVSSYGVTEDGFAKPDIVASGRKVYSTLASGVNRHDVVLAQEFPDRVSADGDHIRLSGTSMSAPMVAGAVALLLERSPGLAPDQIRQLLVGTAKSYPGEPDRAGALNIAAAVAGAQHPPAHTDTPPLPIGGVAPPQSAHTLVWDGGKWANVYWSSAHWDSAHWDTAHWDTAYWDTAHWDSAYWDSAHWDSVYWDTAHWDSAHWDSAHWDSAHWDSAHWDSAHWDSAHWDSAHWDSAGRYD